MRTIFWLVVSTHLKNISQIGHLPQIGVKIKNNKTYSIWNHHLVFFVLGRVPSLKLTVRTWKWMVGRWVSFRPILRGYVSFRETLIPQKNPPTSTCYLPIPPSLHSVLCQIRDGHVIEGEALCLHTSQFVPPWKTRVFEKGLKLDFLDV